MALAEQDGLIAELEAACGADAVSVDPDRRALFGQDVWACGQDPLAVVRPRCEADVQSLMAVLFERRTPAFPRGGGMSYTLGYAPDRPGVSVDLSGLDRIMEINEDDMTVRAGAGCCWATLDAALARHGLRAPFWGPLSGLNSTLGGGASQNNAFFGAGRYGPSSDSVVSLNAVLGDGRLIRTGAPGAQAAPFFRPYGPDMTGLFLADCGALGFKTELTLRLIERPEHVRHASFAFASSAAFCQAMSAVARAGLASEVFGFDPELAKMRLRRASLAADAKTLAKVVGEQGSLLRGAAEGARMAAAGRGFLAGADFTLHVSVEGRSRSGVRDDLEELSRRARKAGGKPIEATIPKVIRAAPYTPPDNMLGPDGERWVPVHGIVPHSKAAACWAEIDALFADRADTFERFGIKTGYLATTLGTTGFLIEPVFTWPEQWLAIHERSVRASHLKKLTRHPAAPDATAAVAQARKAVIGIFARHGAAHFQIGRTYPYAATRSPEQFAVLKALKASLDPAGIVNPGALGLERA